MNKTVHFLQQILTEAEYREIEADDFGFTESMKVYEPEFIDSVVVISIDDKRFLLKKSDIEKMHDKWLTTLSMVAKSESLQNPVYVDVDKDGVLLID